MTPDQIIDSCEDSRAEDWVYWKYLWADPSPCFARAVHATQRAIGLSWTLAREGESCSPPEWTSPASTGECTYHWVDLLYDGEVVDRQLAALLEDAGASLPVPSVEPGGDGTDPALWVSRRAYRLVRLANEVDPGCSDYDAAFARSGLQVR